MAWCGSDVVLFAASAQEGVADASVKTFDASYSLHADDAPVGVITHT